MAVHAHPDDESSKGAAATAKYVDEGVEVMVVTCTGGERGDILNPAMRGVVENEGIYAVRQREMADAARILKVSHAWLGAMTFDAPPSRTTPSRAQTIATADKTNNITHQRILCRTLW